MTEHSEFQGRSVLITGGASGIGEATARRFAAEGAIVTIADLAAERGLTLVDELNAGGGAARFIRADVTIEEEVAAAVEFARGVDGHLDFAANVAGGDAATPPAKDGIQASTDITELERDRFDATLAWSMTSAFLAMKHEIAVMIPQGGGSIVNVTALAGMRVSVATSIAYAAAKAGLAHMTRWAAVKYGAQGIRVNSVAPGFTMTPAVARNTSPQRMAAAMETLHVIPRPAEPSEQANGILWLCSAQSGMITGQEFPIDGGWTAR